MSTLTALWHLSRPRLMPYVLCLSMVGLAWAHWDRALTLRGADAWWWLAAAWWALHAGTLWLNAALDQDEGEVLFGRSVRPPDNVATYGYIALIASVLLAMKAGPVAGGCGAVCAILAVLYSHPLTQWKGHPLGGPLVNGLGYGLLSPMAGWSLAGVTANPRTLLAWSLGLFGVMSCYFMAQAFQEREDAERGYRTLVATHGEGGALAAARVFLGLAFAGGMLLSVLGWFPRICLLGMPMWWWIDRWLARWSRDGGSERDARVFAQRTLGAVVVMMLLVFTEYARESFAGEPVAGLGTATGHPTDRPRLPPRAMAAWERLNNSELR
jgi:4-hydroxybenzoate polyprenyltransferase